jgi:hypothetical protein
MRNRERGAANWPFIISFVLLLIFGWLWFDQKGDADKFRDEVAKEKKIAADATALAREREDRLEEISKVVGFRSATAVTGTTAAGGSYWTDPAQIQNHLKEDGEVTKEDKTKVPGFLAEMKAKSRITIRRDLYTAKEPGAQTAADFSKISPEFKAQLATVRDARPQDVPQLPTDPDDAAERAKYESEKAAYEEKVKNYLAQVEKLVAMQGDWKKYSQVIAGTSFWDPDTQGGNMVDVVYYQKPTGDLTLQALLGVPGPIISGLVTAFSENKNADVATIEAQKKSFAQLETEFTATKDQLTAEQAAHTADVTKLTAERDDANARAEAATVAKTTAEKTLTTTKENLERDIRKLNSTITAHQNRERIDKEVRDLEIKRDDPDGAILEASPTLGTAYVNLGSTDKVFPGLKFNVSYIGRGGLRVYKGQVIVLKVLDAHYSQVSILSQVADERPIGSGDMISNPFYDAKKTIHVFLAGELKKYPKAMAAARLKRANVVIDDAMSPQTDYVVVADSLTAKPAGTEAAPEGEAAPAGGEKSDYDRLSAMAASFGATLVTERMLENFLDY